ncbi:TonB-dependent receptor plug domain-containing protein (plasmid) [Pedobacter sp. BS3]|uniref:TonB-dependent receptor plug domain-containing protein n=1 Tax=Pedobacter sp. BS3 TaxID=2567937 RepID=UPI0011EC1DE8|nr:TonB-dependent receptor plug domain-containing protein [Pedobacter sp. BS3]TZF85674.1 TonB-dependent receptor plug domain-containing protein [Pedobacter sp. BS3]
MKKQLLAAVGLLAVLSFGFIAFEDDPIKEVVTKLERFRNDDVQEKIHLQFDKPYYTIGDNIWFKAYVLNAENNQLSNFSKIIYVDLINDKDSVKQSLRLPVIAGLSWGDFSLPDTLREGNYRVRAYTNWMRNFGDEYFFDKTIQIGNSLSNTVVTDVKYTFSKEGEKEKVDADILYKDMDGNPLMLKDVTYSVQLDARNIERGKAKTDINGHVIISFVNSQPFVLKSGTINTTIKVNDQQTVTKILPVKQTSKDVDVQFFPESGQMVNGIPSRVAFKAISDAGLGVDISGYVADNNNEKITDFKSAHAGMGNFVIVPEEGKTYTAVIKLPDGSDKKVPLPAVQKEGYVLSVNNSNADTLFLRIAASPGLLQNGDLFVVGQTNAVVNYAAKTRLQGSVLSARIPKSKFPTGILQLTLFASANQPVAQRLVFIRHNDQLNVKITPSKTSYGKRDKVKLNLDVKDASGKPVSGAFSMAVTDESKVPYNDIEETTILSNILLSSDLKGYIEKPNYYFTDVTPEKERELDNLMLTQGWSRFVWTNILANNYPVTTFKPEQGITISGTVTMGKKPIAGGKVLLLATKGRVTILDTITDSQGHFVFDNLVFGDDTKFVVQARTAKDKKFVDITLDQVPPALVSRNKNAPDVEVNVNSSMLTYLKNSQKQFTELRRYGMLDRNIVLSEVKITEKKPEVQNSSNLNGAGFADAVIKADQLENCIDLTQCLQGRVAGLIIQNGMAYLMRSMHTPMQIIVDGMYFEPDMLSEINVNDIETIEVLKSIGNTAIYGMRGGGGVLIINTKRGDGVVTRNTYTPGVVTYYPKGYSVSREFYMPKYEGNNVNNKMADLRTTIYWNPKIVTDSLGKASVEFYNSDGLGTYKAVVEGVGLNGKLARKVFRYNVK